MRRTCMSAGASPTMVTLWTVAERIAWVIRLRCTPRQHNSFLEHLSELARVRAIWLLPVLFESSIITLRLDWIDHPIESGNSHRCLSGFGRSKGRKVHVIKFK